MFKIIKKEINWGNRVLVLETGKIARQATAAVTAKMGNTVVLCTVVGEKKAKENMDFFPLTVNYQEKFYSAGKIPGGFNKRESRPLDRETLTSRLIDRPIRPLFPEGYHNEVQVVCTVLSFDPDCQPDIVALIGASAALSISGIPFQGPMCAARVGYKDGEYTLNPSTAELADGGNLDLVVAGTSSAVLMVESEAKELSEEIMLGAVMFGHNHFKPIIKMINEMVEEVGNPRWEVTLADHSDLIKKVKKLCEKKIVAAYDEREKQKRVTKLEAIKSELEKHFTAIEDPEEKAACAKWNSAFKALQKDIVRGKMLSERTRIDGRAEADIRNIAAEVDVLPSVHGSALFTRGETQALVIATLGTGEDEQIIDDIEGDRKDRFLLHYNFPPYSVGEVGRMMGPGRREIGHGKLAYRAIHPLLPTKEEFPYMIRIVSEITESNGSSSMATVCGTSLALMAAGVPLRSPIAGIAMGLIKENKDYVILSDIMGDEDYLGDMDFKVAGTEKGITALQMDIKINGITEEIMEKALAQAQKGRIHILSKMEQGLTASRATVAPTAPQIFSLKIPKDKIGEVIGPGGKVIKDIIERTKVKIDISDDGTVNIASTSQEGMQAAIDIVNEIVIGPEIGKTYQGKVIKMLDFGVVVAFMGKSEGLVHVSEMANYRVASPHAFVKEGEMVNIKVLDMDRSGKVKLSMKGLNPELEAASQDNNSSSGESEGGGGDSQPSDSRRFKRSGDGGGRRRDDRSDRPRRDDRRDDRPSRDRSEDRPRRDDRDERPAREPRRDDRNDDRPSRDRSEDRPRRDDRDERPAREPRRDDRNDDRFEDRGSNTGGPAKKRRFF